MKIAPAAVSFWQLTLHVNCPLRARSTGKSSGNEKSLSAAASSRIFFFFQDTQILGEPPDTAWILDYTEVNRFFGIFFGSGLRITPVYPKSRQCLGVLLYIPCVSPPGRSGSNRHSFNRGTAWIDHTHEFGWRRSLKDAYNDGNWSQERLGETQGGFQERTRPALTTASTWGNEEHSCHALKSAVLVNPF